MLCRRPNSKIMSDAPARQFPYALPDGALDELDSLLVCRSPYTIESSRWTPSDLLIVVPQ